MTQLQKRTLSDGLILGLLSVVLLFVPGFKTLDYYFSAAVSLPLAAAVGGSAIVTFFLPGDLRHNIYKGIIHDTILTLIPLVIVLFGSIFNGLCNPLYSLGFYLMAPVSSAIFAWGVGIGMAGIFRNKRAAFIGFYVLLIASFLENAAYFYFQPQVFFYNPFLGFFPGPIYETAIRIGGPYIAYRLVTTAFAALCATGGLWSTGRSVLRRASVAVIVALIVPLALLSGAYLGFRPRLQEVRQVLNHRIACENIVLRYSPKTSPAYARFVLKDAVARWHDLQRYFHVRDHRRITVYLYPDTETSRRLTGTASVDVAKVWLGQVHITPYQPGDIILEHELAHCFAARFSGTFLHIPIDGLVPRLDLTEGMAVAAAFDSTPLSPHEWSAAMLAGGHVTDPRDLAGFAGFATAAPTKAYIVAGSFMRFLHDHYGAKVVESVYRKGNYSAIPGGVDAAVKAWVRFLSTYKVPRQFADRAEQIATASGVLHARCLTGRSRLKQGLKAAFRHGRLKEALDLTRRLYELSPTPRLRAFEALLQVLAGDLQAGAMYLSGQYQPSADPDVISLAMSIAAPLIRTPADLMDLLPPRTVVGGVDWSDVALKQCMAAEAGPFYGNVMRSVYMPPVSTSGDFVFGPCTAYALARKMLDRGRFARGCALLPDPSLLPTHFQRFDAYISKAWCLFVNNEYRPDLLKAMHKEAIYEGERMAARKIETYSRPRP